MVGCASACRACDHNPLKQVTNCLAKRLLLGGVYRCVVQVQALKSLEVLDLHSNLVETLTGLTALTNLRRLNLAGNRISQLCSLSMLTCLEDLNLSRNFIVSLTGPKWAVTQDVAGSSGLDALVLPESLCKLTLAANRYVDL